MGGTVFSLNCGDGSEDTFKFGYDINLEGNSLIEQIINRQKLP